MGEKGSSIENEENKESDFECSPFQKYHLSHQEILTWEEERGFYILANSLSLQEKTSFHIPVFPNFQEQVERFRCVRCFRIFHSFHSKDEKFCHLWHNKECGCSEKVARTVLSYWYQCLSWNFWWECIDLRYKHQHLMVKV